MDQNTTQTPWGTPPRKRKTRRWAAGAASALAAALLAGGGTAVALQAQGNTPQASATADAAGSDTAAGDESLASLTSLDELGPDVTAADNATDLAQPGQVAPAAATTPSPSASRSAPPKAAKHPARTALRRALAVVIRQDGQAQYGEHAQTAARALINRFPAEFRRLPEKLRQDLWTLAGAPSNQTVADAETVKNNALNGTYGAAVQKLAQAIQKAPAKPKPTAPAPAPSSTPSPSATSGS